MKNKIYLELFWISLSCLFLELFVIRWVSTEIRVFAYVNNLVLLACFIGLGIGGLFKKSISMIFTLICLSLIIALSHSADFKEITNIAAAAKDYAIWGDKEYDFKFLNIFKAVSLIIILFSLIASTFMHFGQRIGKLLDNSDNIIKAYSINIIGSLIGILSFSFLSSYFMPPIVWFTLFFAIIYFLSERKIRNQLVIFGFIATVFILPVGNYIERIWSPYQKLDIVKNYFSGLRTGYALNVNNIGYMQLIDLREEAFINKIPDHILKNRKFNQYEIPYLIKPKSKDILILGSGSGNGPAGALKHGVENIDAVEIDPGVYHLAAKYHPEKPYNNNKVNIIIDDGRSHLANTQKEYDVIVFDLLDSHSMSGSTMNNRIDHYMYTRESIDLAFKRLNEDGLLYIAFEAREKWIAERIFNTLKQVFDKEPIVYKEKYPRNVFGLGGMIFLVSKKVDLNHAISLNPELNNYIKNRKINISQKNDTKITTDDWPYLYLEKPSIPHLFLFLSVTVILILITSLKSLNIDIKRIDFIFFLFGSAFLLLEFQNISKMSALFGSTWIVNVYAISGILILILLGNLTYYWIEKINLTLIFSLLLTSVILNYFIPLSYYNSLGFWMKILLGMLIMNLPIYFSSILYLHFFKKTDNKSIAYGSNLIGATLGGLLESITFITGIKFVLILVLVFYFSIFLLARRK